MRWLAPTDQFLEFGAEIFRGDAYPAAGAAHGGQGTVTAFVHTGNDINDSSSYLAALSYLHSRADRTATPRAHLFTGNDDLGIASLVYKWAPGGNPDGEQSDARRAKCSTDARRACSTAPASRQNRFGWYAQGVYQFMPQWSFGLRYAAI